MLYGDLKLVDTFPFPEAIRDALVFLRDRASTMADGKHDQPGGGWAEIKHYAPAPATERFFEAHVKFIDVQYVIEGEEEILVRPLTDTLKVKDDFMADRDLVYYHEPSDPELHLPVVMRPGKFLVLFPEDVHKTECKTTVASGRKVIYKVPVF